MSEQTNSSHDGWAKTHREIAEILTMAGYPTSTKVVWHLEKSALRKLAADPSLQRLADDIGLNVTEQ